MLKTEFIEVNNSLITKGDDFKKYFKHLECINSPDECDD